MVECFLAKEDVAGSNPVSRSNLAFVILTSWSNKARSSLLCMYNTGRGTQVVRERSAKPLCVGSIPTRASIFSITHDHLELKLPPLLQMFAFKR